MLSDIHWNKKLFEQFVEEEMLNERLRYVLETRIKGSTIDEQADALCVSRSTINRAIKELKRRINESQLKPYDF